MNKDRFPATTSPHSDDIAFSHNKLTLHDLEIAIIARISLGHFGRVEFIRFCFSRCDNPLQVLLRDRSSGIFSLISIDWDLPIVHSGEGNSAHAA